MAYTSAPTQDTHNVRRVPSIGSPVLVTGTAASKPYTLSYSNCFPMHEKQWGTDPKLAVHKRESWVGVPLTGTVTATGFCNFTTVRSAADDNTFIAKDSTYYLIDCHLETVTAVTTSTTAFGAWQSSGTNCRDSTNVARIAFLDVYYELKTFQEDGTSVTTTDLTTITAQGQKGIVFINGYLFAVSTNGQKIYNSTVGGLLTTWATTDWISAEQWGDPVLYIANHKNYLVAFGTQSIEFLYDAGVEIGSPLTRQENYASKVGLKTVSGQNGRHVAYINDDIYFIGSGVDRTLSLYKISEFKVERVHAPFIDRVLNYQISENSPNTNYVGIETLHTNQQRMVLLNFSTGPSLVYFPDEDSWWELPLGEDFIIPSNRNSTTWNGDDHQPTFVAYATANTDTTLYLYYPSTTVAVTSTIYSEVIDFGINYYKHIARVDAIGDYGANALTLYYNPTPKYSETYVSCYSTRTPSTDGYGVNNSWYNLGGFRRFSLKFVMAGAGPGVHQGFDIEYNLGAT